jgi:hypothetical protein
MEGAWATRPVERRSVFESEARTVATGEAPSGVERIRSSSRGGSATAEREPVVREANVPDGL